MINPQILVSILVGLVILWIIYWWAERNDRPDIQVIVLDLLQFFLNSRKWLVPVVGLIALALGGIISHVAHGK